MRSGWCARLGLVALGVACLLGISIPIAIGGDSTPTWQLKSYYTRGLDRSFKADLYEEMPSVPRVLVFGGSRSLRMDPATIKRETGLTAFNFGFHNGRPEDVWAVIDWALDSHPDEPPAVIWCVQATTLADVPMNGGLIVDQRLSQAFPQSLIDAKMSWAMKQPKRNFLSGRRYGFDGMLWWNVYDARREAGLTLQQVPRRLPCREAGHGGQRQGPPEHARHGLLREDHPVAERAAHQAAHRDHAVPPAGAGRVPLRGLGRQGAVAARLPLRTVRASGLPRAELPEDRFLRRHGGRVLRRRAYHGSELAAAHPPLHRARVFVLQAARASDAHAEPVAELERESRRRWCRLRRTRRCPRTRASPRTSSSSLRRVARGAAAAGRAEAPLRRRSAS